MTPLIRAKSPILHRGRRGRAWAARGPKDDEEPLWLCASVVRLYWEIPRGVLIQLVASGVYVKGAQQVRLPDAGCLALLPTEKKRHLTFAPFFEFLEGAARVFGKRNFYGWIEIIQ